jgi:hypothetical protein
MRSMDAQDTAALQTRRSMERIPLNSMVCWQSSFFHVHGRAASNTSLLRSICNSRGLIRRAFTGSREFGEYSSNLTLPFSVASAKFVVSW